MCEPIVLDVVDEFDGQLVVAQPWLPRCEVHFVDAHRPRVWVALGAGGHPLRVVPLMVRREDHGRGCGWNLRGVCIRVGLESAHSVMPEDVELVTRTVTDLRDEDLPDSGGSQ